MRFDPANSIAQAFVGALSATITASLGPVEVVIKAPFPKQNIDARLEKIEDARRSLSDALIAVDALKLSAEENKRDLEKLVRAIEQAQLDKKGAHEELKALRGLVALDSDAVRRVLSPPIVEVWRERIIGIGLGVVASVVAAGIWELFVKRIWAG